jgi:hypothetical protein
MKHFYKGDIIVKEEDADMRWAITSGQRFFVISTIHYVDGYSLIYRPFRNKIKYMFYRIIQINDYLVDLLIPS